MAKGWLEENAPGVHRFLTRRDRPYPFLREALAVILVIGVLVGLLYGLTGQSFSGAPVVVVTTGSMMHCKNYGEPGSELGIGCHQESYGRIGSIDPGDLVFVRAISAASDVTTEADATSGSHYGRSGDVVVYHPNGVPGQTPIIHRALFYLQIEANGTMTVAEFGLYGVHRLNQPNVEALVGCELSTHGLGMESSGFVTRGDNNRAADQCGGILPARVEWVLGKARGEVPWIGLIKLFVDDLRGNNRNFANASNDSKVMLVVVIVVLVGSPWVIELGLRRRARRRAGKPGPPKQDDGKESEPDADDDKPAT